MERSSGEHFDTRQQSIQWVIDARWYYTLLAFVFTLALRHEATFTASFFFLVGLLVAALFSNATFAFLLGRYGGVLSLGETRFFTIAQIGVDLLFFLGILLLAPTGGVNPAHSFLFVPVMISVVFFGLRGAVIVALISGLLVLFSALLGSGFIAELLAPPHAVPFSRELAFLLVEVGVVAVLYQLVGFFGGYIAKLLSVRDLSLHEEIKRESAQVSRLEELTQEFDQSAKLLVRRDLELSSANEKLTQLDKLKSEIISIAAHQLRTPLSAIKWTLKVILDQDVGVITSEQRDLLLKGFDSNERMITLVNDMLAVDRLESGRLKYNFIPVQFEELVDAMLRDLLPLARQKNVRLEFAPPKVLLPKIKVDPDKMRDVLQNLIDNAIKYSGEGGAVVVTLGEENGELHFSVKDNGIGIPDEQKDRIFSRFFRAANAIKSGNEGSGLGLFIASSVVKRHGGKVWFESVMDVGTTFHMLLPFSPL